MKKRKKEKIIPEVMSLSQLKLYMHASYDKVKMLVEDGEIKGRKLGDRWRVHKSEVDRWLACKEA